MYKKERQNPSHNAGRSPDQDDLGHTGHSSHSSQIEADRLERKSHSRKFPWMIPRRIIVKRKGETNPQYGKPPSERTITELMDACIANLDKPSGPNSHQIAAYARKIINSDKSGHSGTLDPKVTGALPTAFGRGTRIVQSLLTAGKEYVCLMKIHKELPEEKIRKAISSFEGEIDQLPPVRSAVKRQLRKRNIYYIDIIEIAGTEVLFKVGCQAGTYIRKLCSDIGLKLGCGAHMAELRRTRAGPFDENTICTLQDLTDAYYKYTHDKDESYLRKILHPVEDGASHLKKVWITDSAIDTLCHGAFLNVPGIVKLESGIEKGERIAILSLKEELVCVGIAQMTSEDAEKKDKGLFAKPDQVFMTPGTYPRRSSGQD